jgi:DNA polymerase IV
VSNLDTDGYVQLELPFQPDESDGLDKALDAIRDRFGGSSVTRAVNLGQDLGPSVPILSD